MSLPPTTSKISGDSTDLVTFKYRFPNFTGSHSGTIVSLGVNSVAGGGTGDSSLTAYAPLFGGTTSTGAVQSGSVGTAGQALISNGAGAIATFQNLPSITEYIWSGYHGGNTGTTNPWSITGGTTFTDFANADATMSLTEVNNVNFGTVTGYGASSGASALPGIVFTPGATGVYFVKASVCLNYNSVGNQSGLRLWDGTTIIDNGIVYNNSGQAYYSITLSGELNISSLSAKTISIQGVANATFIALVGGTFFSTNVNTINWTIFKIN